MSKESISTKLSELFHLYKSGALTIDEYDLLKHALLNEGNISKIEGIDSKKQIEFKNVAKKTVLEDRLKDDPLNVQILHEYAQFLFNNLLFKDAITVSFKILAINENDEEAKDLIFKLYLKLNWLKEALEFGEQLLSEKPTDIPLLEELAKISVQLGDSIKVDEYYDVILELQPTNTDALHNKALHLLEVNQLESAVEIFKKIYNEGSSDKITSIYAGIDKSLSGDFEAAIKILSEIISNYKPNDLSKNRGIIYLLDSLCETSADIREISQKYSLIDFEILKHAYHSLDEQTVIKVVEFIINQRLNDINTDNQIKQLTESYFNNGYFTKNSNSMIAEIWYAIGKKQVELKLFYEALDSLQRARNLVLNESKYKKRYTEIKKLLEDESSKRNKKRNIVIASIIFGLMIISISIFAYKIFEENIAYKYTKFKNTLSAYNSYLDKYPNGKHIHEIDGLREDSIWVVIKEVNFLYGYRYYLSLYPEGKFVLEAKNAKDSLLGINKTMRIENHKFWNDAAARKIVLTELKQFPNWSNFSNNQNFNWKHEILQFNKIELLESDFMVVITHSNYSNNDCHACSGYLSIFEFAYNAGWKLRKKSIAFTNGAGWGLTPSEIRLAPISSDNYAIIIKYQDTGQGYLTEDTNFHSYINDSIKCILSLTTASNSEGAGKNGNSNSYLMITKKDDGFYPIKQLEIGTQNDGSKIDNRILYIFNGKEYINTSGIKPYGNGY